MKLRGLNWNGQNLEDWTELWPNIEGAMCNLAKRKFTNMVFYYYFFALSKLYFWKIILGNIIWCFMKIYVINIIMNKNNNYWKIVLKNKYSDLLWFLYFFILIKNCFQLTVQLKSIPQWNERRNHILFALYMRWILIWDKSRLFPHLSWITLFP